MSIDEARRLMLHDTAREHWTPEAALALMEMLPPTGWADVATRQQLEALEDRLTLRFSAADQHLVSIDQRFEQIDQRFKQVDRRFDQIERQTQRRFDETNQHIDASIARLGAELRGEFSEMRRELLVWNVATMLTIVGIAVAFLRLT